MSTPFIRRRVFLALACLAVAGSLYAAEPVAPGVSNFHQVAPHIYRGAQPTEQGFESLVKLGVRTVLDLRSGKDVAEQQAVERLGMQYIHIPMHGLSRPTDEQIGKAMAVLVDETHGPVFVHCMRGADRTGTVIACYRIAREEWAAEKALAEAKQYGMSPFQRAMKQYILKYHVTPSEQTIKAAPSAR